MINIGLLSNAFYGPSGGQVLDNDLQAVLDEGAINGYSLPSAETTLLLNTFVTSLKSIGVWNKLDALYVFANDGDENFRSINYINPSVKGSPLSLSSQKHGFQGMGVTNSYFNTNFNPATGTNKYQLNSASRGAFIFTTSTANHIIDSSNGTANLMFNDTVNSHRINSGTNGLVSGTKNMGGVGYKAINRSDVNSLQLYNGKTQYTDTRSSSSISNASQYLFRYNTNYSNAGISVYFMGSSLTQQEHSDFADAIQALVDMLGPVAPIVDTTTAEIIQGSAFTINASVLDSSTIIWKDSLGATIHTGASFTVPTTSEGLFTYYAVAVNSTNVESDPVEITVQVKSIDNSVLVEPMHTYAESGSDVVIRSIAAAGITLDYYDSSDTLLQSGGDLTLSGLSVGTHEFYAIPVSGGTEYNQIPITVIVIAEYPDVDMNTMYKLVINDGLPDSQIIYNEEVQPAKIRLIPKNAVLNNISLDSPDHTFSPRATSVIMDSDKTLNFTPNGN